MRLDANAGGEAQHWTSSWQVLETSQLNRHRSTATTVTAPQLSGEDMAGPREASGRRRRPTRPRLKLTEKHRCRCRS